MRTVGVVIGSSFAIAALVFACGSARMPAPIYVSHPTTALLPVRYPPPPARVEFVPEEPKTSGAVWIDGEWIWQTGRWAWRSGYWIVPPPGAAFSPSTLRRKQDGTLFLAPGAWWSAAGEQLDARPTRASVEVREGPVVRPEGKTEKAAPNIKQE